MNFSREVLNEIGHGFHEKIYENALVVEFGLRRIPVNQQPDFPVIYKSVNVGSYVPDLIWSSSAFICVHLRFALNEFAYFRTS